VAVEGVQPAVRIRVPGGPQLIQDMGVAADDPLAEDDERPGQDVGALHGDADRDGLVSASQQVPGPQADAGAPEGVHGIVEDPPHRFRALDLHGGAET